MSLHLCYFKRDTGTVVAWRALPNKSDGEARDHALGLFAAYPRADKVEVYDQARLILSYLRSDARTPTELRRLSYLAIDAAKKETDPEIRRVLASRAFALAQEAEALERSSAS
jgi:hypothetical protein